MFASGLVVESVPEVGNFVVCTRLPVVAVVEVVVVVDTTDDS